MTKSNSMYVVHLLRKLKIVSKMVIPFCIPIAVYKSYIFFHMFPKLDMVGPFKSSLRFLLTNTMVISGTYIKLSNINPK